MRHKTKTSEYVNLEGLLSHKHQPRATSPSDTGELKLRIKLDIVRYLKDAIKDYDDTISSIAVAVLCVPNLVLLLKYPEYTQNVLLPYA